MNKDDYVKACATYLEFLPLIGLKRLFSYLKYRAEMQEESMK